MKKIILLVYFFTMLGLIHAQVGIGTPIPNVSSQLDIVANDRGILIPRISLTGSRDSSTIVDGNVVSLLVYNTNTVVNEISPGYYYWDGLKWQRIINKDDIANITTKDSDKLTNNGAGTFTHTAADGTAVNFDITQTDEGSPNTNGTTGALGSIYIDESTGNVWTFNGSSWVNQNLVSSEPWFGTDDDMAATENTEDIYSLGRLGVGTIRPLGALHVSTENSDDAIFVRSLSGDLTNDMDIDLIRTYGTTAAPQVIDQDGTSLGGLRYRGFVDHNSNPLMAIPIFAAISAHTDGTPSAGSAPGKLLFMTTPDGSTSNTVRMTIKNDGNIGIGTTTPNEKLEVNGKVRIGDLTGTDADNATNPDFLVTADDVTGELKAVPMSTLDADLRLVGTSNHITRDAGVGSNGTNAGTGSGRNTAIGPDALSSITTGFDNIAIGFNTLSSATDARNNIALGWNSLSSYVSGPLNIGIGNSSLRYHVTGAENIAMGFASLQNHIDGASNLSIGNKSFRNLANGDFNIALGVSAGDNLTTGSNNLILGTNIDLPDSTGSNQLNIGNIIYGTSIDGTGTSLSTGNVGIGTTTPNKKLEVDSNTPDESGLRLSQINATTTTIQQAGTLGVDTDGDVVPIMRNETVFVGKVTDGAVVAPGYVRLPLDAVYDPLGQWDNVNHIWTLPNDGYIYEYHVSLNRNDMGAGIFTRYRPNSATIIPLPTTTGQSFGYSYSGVASLSGGLGNHFRGIPIMLLNNSGANVTLTGIAISRGYWTLTIKRLGKI